MMPRGRSTELPGEATLERLDAARPACTEQILRGVPVRAELEPDFDLEATAFEKLCLTKPLLKADRDLPALQTCGDKTVQAQTCHPALFLGQSGNTKVRSSGLQLLHQRAAASPKTPKKLCTLEKPKHLAMLSLSRAPARKPAEANSTQTQEDKCSFSHLPPRDDSIKIVADASSL